MQPKIILLFSGKRKSGKDYITDRLHEILGDGVSCILKISQPIKSYWAKTLNLDLDKLLGDGEYKEKYRLEMIKWSEDMRHQDYGYFCKLTCDSANHTPIWIVSDIRRRTDLIWFREQYGSSVKTVKVIADDEIRKKRGWCFTPGVDDAESECDLDGVLDWDYLIDNNKPNIPVEDLISDILDMVKEALK